MPFVVVLKTAVKAKTHVSSGVKIIPQDSVLTVSVNKTDGTRKVLACGITIGRVLLVKGVKEGSNDFHSANALYCQLSGGGSKKGGREYKQQKKHVCSDSSYTL
ncbi:hypothetical protein MAR_017739 [Mya arenaria]|uniref:Uncharacterized protein n=1 Tax=Mya arenaria TaxID=6604 RepID=A0ABY7EKR5_MYAAR|nr:hypothetical protein MAR_017739 [Mya arenaria]